MWSLSKMHQVGELTAAAAVVISLLFIGYEMRQNNEAHIKTATQAVVRDFIGAIRSVSTDAELACIFSSGVQDYRGLSGSERLRFGSYFLSIFYTVQEMHNLVEQGSMDPRIWRGFEMTFQEVLQLPGVRQWLANRIHWFSNEFQLYLHDDAMHQPSPADPIIYDDPACSANDGA